MNYNMKEEFNKIYEACKDGDIKRLNKLYILIKKEKFQQIINQTNKEGKTCLYIACSNYHLEIVNLLILENADINKVNNDGETPIYIGCWYNHIEIVKLLISANADINKTSIWGSTPIFISCSRGYLQIVKLLLYHEVDMTNITLSNYITKLNIHNDFSNTSTNIEIRSYLIKEINWNHRKHLINFLDKTSFIYNDRNEETKVLNKKNRDRLSLNAHNCIYNNHPLIACFLG